jgi:two-component system, NtrC family, nitrogen regulation sensor histidine kinase GlnL
MPRKRLTGSGKAGEIVITTAYRPGIKMPCRGRARASVCRSRWRCTTPVRACPTTWLAHIFDPFVTSKSGGRGLGLALVAKIVRDHGGIVECDTGPRRTSFRVLLPLYSEPDAVPGGGPS